MDLSFFQKLQISIIFGIILSSFGLRNAPPREKGGGSFFRGWGRGGGGATFSISLEFTFPFLLLYGELTPLPLGDFRWKIGSFLW
jgi:hypothetical protein